MLRLRRLPLLLGAVVIGTIAACLVFDGRVANVANEAGDASGIDPGDDAPADDATSDTLIGDAGMPGTDGGNDGGGSEGGAKDGGGSDGHISTRIPCGAKTCAGGSAEKCCALPDKIGQPGPWHYAAGPCSSSCSTALPDKGYYDYECDDNDGCQSGDVCCGYRNEEAPPPFSNAVCRALTKCKSPDMELCQPYAKRGCTHGTCEPADSAFLPPGYSYCK